MGEKAVEANLSLGGRRRTTREARLQDLGLDYLPVRLPWVPRTPFSRARPMWRRGHHDLSIQTVADFYSARNLAAFARLWREAGREPDERMQEALRFSLTAIANRASRRYQWNPKRPTNVLGGTLYVSSLRYEWNVLSLWRRKTAAIARMFAESAMPAGAVDVRGSSATDLSLSDESVDYIFTDPPFGGHIVYSDASLLWEAWLNEYTDRDREAIVVAGGDASKTVKDYEAVLRRSFLEMRRVLKANGHATVVFQATDPEVWLAIQRGAADAGLHLVQADTLAKGQPSFKQIKGRSGERVATDDVLLTFAKRSTGDMRSLPTGDGRRGAGAPLIALRESIAAARPEQPIATGRLFATVNARLLSSGAAHTVGYDEMVALLREHFIESDDGWYQAP